MAVAIQTPAQPVVSTTDAIWTLIVGQSKSIQKTLAKRLSEHLEEEKRLSQEKLVRESLMAAMREVKAAEKEGRKAGRPVQELMNELFVQ